MGLLGFDSCHTQVKNLPLEIRKFFIKYEYYELNNENSPIQMKWTLR